MARLHRPPFLSSMSLKVKMQLQIVIFDEDSKQ